MLSSEGKLLLLSIVLFSYLPFFPFIPIVVHNENKILRTNKQIIKQSNGSIFPSNSMKIQKNTTLFARGCLCSNQQRKFFNFDQSNLSAIFVLEIALFHFDFEAGHKVCSFEYA